MRLHLIWATATFMASVSAASANCRVQPFRFFPSQNDSVSTTATTTNGVCVAQFSAGGSTSFTMAEIAGKPSHGTLTQTGNFAFRYAAAKGYRGADSFILKVCGATSAGKGCSRLTYNMVVQ